MKIELGKIQEQFVTLPKFMLHLRRNTHNAMADFVCGQLYRGYKGIMWNTNLFCLDLWISTPLSTDD